jgi:DNA-binding response OmpR family regulator
MDNGNIKVLIVEDEESIRRFISINLIRNNFEVIEADTGELGVKLVKEKKPDVVVLDIMLPGIDGYKVCEEIRKIIPDLIIIMLTAKSQDMDKIMGLELGADDYMVKPFNPLELVARIRAILRRAKKNDNSGLLKIRNLSMDLNSKKFYKNDKEIELTPTEFSIMKLFMKNPEKAFSRNEILNLIWGENYFGDLKTVDVHVRRLREKIEDDASIPQVIETIWGTGYRLRGDK